MLEGAKLRRVGSEQRSVVGKEPHPKPISSGPISGLWYLLLKELEEKTIQGWRSIIKQQAVKADSP